MVGWRGLGGCPSQHRWSAQRWADGRHGRSERNNWYCRYCSLSSLNIQEKRVSVEKVGNTYGNRLLELRKSANMYIINGRFDNDALQGKATCDNVSVVDYVICSSTYFLT